MKKDIRDLKEDNTTLKTDNEIFKREVEDLKVKIQPSNDELILGELCRRVQSMIYQKILPEGFRKNTENYKISNMDDQLFAIFDTDEYKINEAMQAWEELQKELKWEGRRLRVMILLMKEIQQERNRFAHPEITEDILMETIERMDNAGLLVGNLSRLSVMELIHVWKKLNEKH